jgi:hypothetical protein
MMHAFRWLGAPIYRNTDYRIGRSSIRETLWEMRFSRGSFAC